jgi:hypothetical protein
LKEGTMFLPIGDKFPIRKCAAIKYKGDEMFWCEEPATQLQQGDGCLYPLCDACVLETKKNLGV